MKTFRITGEATVEATDIKEAYHRLGEFYLNLAEKPYGWVKPFKTGHLYIMEKKNAKSRR